MAAQAGRLTGVMAAAVKASSVTARYTNGNGWRLSLDDSVPEWCAWVDLAQRLTLVNRETFLVISEFTPATSRLHGDVMDVATGGMLYIPAASEPYAEAIRRWQQRMETEGRTSVDVLSDLQRRTQALLTEAASISASRDRPAYELFAVRYARLARELGEQRGRLAQAQAMLDLASEAMAQAL